MNEGLVIGKVVNALLDSGARTATQFLSAKKRVRVSRLVFKGRFSRKAVELVVSVGKPNCEERETLRRARRLGNPFVVLFLKPLPKKK